MKDPYIINTHSHANMLKETPPEFALQTAQAERIITIVPSCNSQDIFEVDEFIKKFPEVYGYVGVFPEEAKTFTEKTLSDMENLIKNKSIYLNNIVDYLSQYQRGSGVAISTA